MLLGNHLAKIDSKSRLRVPTQFRPDFAKGDDSACYVTSDTGQCVHIYPLSVWLRFAEELIDDSVVEGPSRRYQRKTSNYGLLTKMDSQGRILIPQELREHARMQGEVKVIGLLDHIEVWNKEVWEQDQRDHPLTAADFKYIGDQRQKRRKENMA